MAKYNNEASTNLIHILLDIIFGGVTFFLAIVVSGHLTDGNLLTYASVAASFMSIYLITNKESNVYNQTTFFYLDRVLKYISKAMLITTSITSVLLFYVGDSKMDKNFYLIFLFMFYAFMLISAYVARAIMRHRKASDHRMRTLLIGKIEHFERFEHFLERSNIDVEIVGHVSMLEEPGDTRYVGSLADIDYLVHSLKIDSVYFMNRHDDPLDIQPYLDLLTEMGITISIIMNSFKMSSVQNYVTSVGTYPVVTYHTVSLSVTARFIKRGMDIIGSVLGIILGSIIMIPTAIAIKIDSKGPVFFRQTRIGKNGRAFKMFKFRSMVVNADEMKKDLMAQNEVNSDLFFKIKDDPRITRVGRFIRKTSIDELPQFFNVLKGDMSLVGTRPPTVEETRGYSHSHWRRLSIKPGITGMWQVSGRSSITDFDEVVRLDVQYIDKWSIPLDISILLKTVLNVLTRRGAS